MSWISLWAILLCGLALASQVQSRRLRAELFTGRPSVLSVVAYTLIARRNLLEQLCGPVGRDGRFTISPARVQALPRDRLASILGGPWLDLVVLIAGLAALIVDERDPATAWTLISAAAAIVLTGLADAITESRLLMAEFPELTATDT